MKNLSAVKISLLAVVLLAALIWVLPNFSKKTIRGDFYLLEFDESVPPNYYVCRKGVESGGGVFDGVVEKLGVKNNELFAKIKRLASIDSDGWYKLNLDTGLVTGPLDFERDCNGVSVQDASSFFQN